MGWNSRKNSKKVSFFKNGKDSEVAILLGLRAFFKSKKDATYGRGVFIRKIGIITPY